MTRAADDPDFDGTGFPRRGRVGFIGFMAGALLFGR